MNGLKFHLSPERAFSFRPYLAVMVQANLFTLEATQLWPLETQLGFTVVNLSLLPILVSRYFTCCIWIGYIDPETGKQK